MKKVLLLLITCFLLFSCQQGGDDAQPAESDQPKGLTVEFETPDVLAVPDAKPVSSEDDWEAKVHNKNIEIVQVLNILNPVAAYLTAGFKQHGEKINKPYIHEEWEDTQAQLGAALGQYKSCQERIDKKEFNKKLFLDLEGTWQILVKTGVAGVRTKQMLDEELAKLNP